MCSGYVDMSPDEGTGISATGYLSAHCRGANSGVCGFMKLAQRKKGLIFVAPQEFRRLASDKHVQVVFGRDL